MGCINTQKQRIAAASQYRHQMQDRSYWRLRVASEIECQSLPKVRVIMASE